MQTDLSPIEARTRSGPADPPIESGGIELLTFRVGGQCYAVDIMSVREIRGWAHATSLPHAPPYVRGVINLRGTVLPVIDLALRLGIEIEVPTDRSVVIVVFCSGRTVGMRVEAVTDIVTLPRGDLQPPPDLAGSGAQACLHALTLIDGAMVRVLDLAGVMPSGVDDAA
jgi:purine-binding chemotaxis protein CheW